MMLLLILGIIFVLGWPLEWVPIVLIVVPILLPLVQKLGIDLRLVLHAGRGVPADGVAVAAGGAVGVLPEGRGTGLGPFRHLRRDDAVHGAADRRAAAGAAFPQLALWLPAALRD